MFQICCAISDSDKQSMTTKKKKRQRKPRNKQNEGTPCMARCKQIVEVEQRAQTAEAISSQYCVND